MIGSLLDLVEAARTTLTRATEDLGWQRAYDVLSQDPGQPKIGDAVEFDSGLTFVRPVSHPGALLIYPDLASAVEATGSPFNVRSASGTTLYRASSSTQTAAGLGLTQTEMRLLRLLAQGRSNKEMAVEMHMANSTVKNRLSIVFDKIGVQDRTQAALRALNLGLITFDEAGA